MELLEGEQTGQVLEAVPARGRVLEQADVDEAVEGVPGLLDRHLAGDGGQVGVEIRSPYGGQPTADHRPDPGKRPPLIVEALR
ncbi:hypothetical protein ACFV30_42840 [Streptomyces sp. NPDC059752]|uniref:hypothetical protein n=1 Tax=unclassified Streptomyces TaxID=2593676 RepID=UPI00364CE672